MTTALTSPVAAPTSGYRVRRRALRVPRPAVAFVLVGTAGTVAYLGLYLLLRTVLPAAVANLGAQVVSTLLSTAWHRRWTVGVTDPASAAWHHVQMLGLLGANLVLNTAALQLLPLLDPTAGWVAELVALSLSGLVVTVARIGLLRRWSAG